MRLSQNLNTSPKIVLSDFNTRYHIVDNIKYQERFKIRASEVDFQQKATLPAICDLLQEVAGNHAQKLNFDITDLQEEKLTWVLHRLFIKIERYPDWRETITIETWPSSGDGLRAYRDFLIKDTEDKIIGRCLSYWLMMNIESRRPTRIPKEILEMAPINIDHVLTVNKANFAEIQNPDNKISYEVRKTDLDLNQHVNNVRYVEWALSCLPEKSNIRELDIQFLAESVAGDTDIAAIKEKSDSEDKIYLHKITRDSDQEVLARAQSKLQG